MPPTVRETVVAVGANAGGGEGGVGGAAEISLTALAKVLGLDKNSTHHRVRKAIERGYLVNREEKRGMPARIAIADPLPDEFEILPPVEDLGDCWSVGAPMEGVKARGGEEGKGPEAEPPSPPLLPPNQHPNTPTPRPGRTCACCGKADPTPNGVSVDGLTVWLHPSCEAAYLAQLDLRRAS